jgi:hypothetical protein
MKLIDAVCDVHQDIPLPEAINRIVFTSARGVEPRYARSCPVADCHKHYSPQDGYFYAVPGHYPVSVNNPPRCDNHSEVMFLYLNKDREWVCPEGCPSAGKSYPVPAPQS